MSVASIQRLSEFAAKASSFSATVLLAAFVALAGFSSSVAMAQDGTFSDARGWRLEFKPPTGIQQLTADTNFNICVTQPNSEQCRRQTQGSSAGEIQNDVWKSLMETCIACPIIQMFVVGLDFNSKYIYALLADAMFLILPFVVILFITWQLMRLFVPWGDYASGGPFQKIGVALLYYIVALVFLAKPTRGVFFEWVYDPIYIGGLEFAMQTMNAMVSACTGLGAGIEPPAGYQYSGATFVGTVGAGESIRLIEAQQVNGLLGFIHNLQRLAGIGIVLGYQVMTAIGIGETFWTTINVLDLGNALAAVPRLLFQVANGIVLMTAYAIVMLAAAYYIIDIATRIAIITVSIPLASLGVVIPSMRNWFGVALKGLFASALTLVLASVVLTISGSTLCYIVGGLSDGGDVNGLFARQDQGGAVRMTMLDALFWILLCIPLFMGKALSRASDLANRIAGSGIGGGSGVGSMLSRIGGGVAAAAGATALMATAAVASAGALSVGRVAMGGVKKAGGMVKNSIQNQ